MDQYNRSRSSCVQESQYDRTTVKTFHDRKGISLNDYPDDYSMYSQFVKPLSYNLDNTQNDKYAMHEIFKNGLRLKREKGY